MPPGFHAFGLYSLPGWKRCGIQSSQHLCFPWRCYAVRGAFVLPLTPSLAAALDVEWVALGRGRGGAAFCWRRTVLRGPLLPGWRCSSLTPPPRRVPSRVLQLLPSHYLVRHSGDGGFPVFRHYLPRSPKLGGAAARAATGWACAGCWQQRRLRMCWRYPPALPSLLPLSGPSISLSGSAARAIFSTDHNVLSPSAKTLELL